LKKGTLHQGVPEHRTAKGTPEMKLQTSWIGELMVVHDQTADMKQAA
jgi:hypothetical protein